MPGSLPATPAVLLVPGPAKAAEIMNRAPPPSAKPSGLVLIEAKTGVVLTEASRASSAATPVAGPPEKPWIDEWQPWLPDESQRSQAHPDWTNHAWTAEENQAWWNGKEWFNQQKWDHYYISSY